MVNGRRMWQLMYSLSLLDELMRDLFPANQQITTVSSRDRAMFGQGGALCWQLELGRLISLGFPWWPFWATNYNLRGGRQRQSDFFFPDESHKFKWLFCGE